MGLHKYTPTPEGYSLRFGFSFLFSLLICTQTHTHCSLPSWLSSPLLAAFPPLVPADGSKSGAASGTKPVGPHRAQPPPPSLVSTSWLGGSHGNEKTSAFPSRFIQILPHPQQPGVPCTYYTELWRQSRTKDANPWVTFKEQQLSLRNICPLEVSFIICHDSLAHI